MNNEVNNSNEVIINGKSYPNLWDRLHEQGLNSNPVATYNSSNYSSAIGFGTILIFIILICVLIYIFVNHNKK